MKTTTRSQAINAGQNRYFTGKPCPKGHVAERYVQSSACLACIRANTYKHRPACNDGERVIFADMVSRVRLRVPLRRLDALRDMAEAMLHARFPGLTHDRRVSFRPPLKMTHKAGGTAMVALPMHRDDAATIKAIADAELLALSADNFRGLA